MESPVNALPRLLFAAEKSPQFLAIFLASHDEELGSLVSR